MDETQSEHGWISYVAYKLRPEYRVMPEVDRFQLAAFLTEILESPHDRVDVDCYCAVGLRADCDFFVRYTAPTLAELQEICVKVANSGLGRHLDVAHDWVARRRPGRAGDGGPTGEADWLVVHPFSVQREFFALASDERARLVGECVEIGREHPQVAADAASSFGLGDQDWVLGFQVSDLAAFEALTRALRATELARLALVDAPVLLGRHVSAHEVLEMCGAL